MRTLSPISLLILFHRNFGASSTCYWPDRSVVSEQMLYTPCNLTANGVGSACCGESDVCSSGGYCLGTDGYMLRLYGHQLERRSMLPELKKLYVPNPPSMSAPLMPF